VPAFEALTRWFVEDFLIHHSPTRPRIAPDDTTQGVAPGQEAIALHAERAYLPGRPEMIFFHCVQAPDQGGETTICDGAAIFDAFPPALQRTLESTTLVWETTIARASWTRAWTMREDEPIADVITRLRHAHGDVADYAIDADGETLRVRFRCPCVERGWIGGRRAFANYLLLEESGGPQARLASGEPVPADWLAEARAVADRLTMEIRWHTGDVVMLDNTGAPCGGEGRSRPDGQSARRPGRCVTRPCPIQRVACGAGRRRRRDGR
jgi:hypothetical protein